jgi:phosphoribosyl-ATP pyrophosphohydrolase
LAKPGKTEKKKVQAAPRAAAKSSGRKGQAKHKAKRVDAEFDPKAQLLAAFSKATTQTPLAPGASASVLDRLFAIINSRKNADPDLSHSARLISRGTPRIAQKLGEEAVECLIELMAGNRRGIIDESADLLYHLLVIWVQSGIQPTEVWQELHQRETVSHLTEGNNMPLKRLLGSVQIGTSKIP